MEMLKMLSEVSQAGEGVGILWKSGVAVFLVSAFFGCLALARRRARVGRRAPMKPKMIDLFELYHLRPKVAKTRRSILTGIGVAVLGSMLLPAPASANEFNLAERLSQNLKSLRRMQTQGAAILIPADFQEAMEAQEEAMHHAQAIVKLRAFQVNLAERRKAAVQAGRKDVVGSLDSLNRWTRLEIFEHDSAAVRVSEKVSATAHRFAVLQRFRWLVRQMGVDAPEISSLDLPEAYRARVQAHVDALKQVKKGLALMAEEVTDPMEQLVHGAVGRSEMEEAALSIHRTERPNLYPLTAWRR